VAVVGAASTGVPVKPAVLLYTSATVLAAATTLTAAGTMAKVGAWEDNPSCLEYLIAGVQLVPIWYGAAGMVLLVCMVMWVRTDRVLGGCVPAALRSLQ
jgi:hypothetical protein